MEVRCDKCQARYRVDDARVGPQGLTMRCGKCQNTFKVTRPAEPAATVPEQAPIPAAPRPAPAKPAPQAPGGGVGSTMVFGQPPARPVAPPAAPSRPGSTGGKPAASSAAAAEGAGRTMMFQTGNLKAPPPKPKAEPEAGSTMVFGQSPVLRPAAPLPAIPKPPGTGRTPPTAVKPPATVKPPAAKVEAPEPKPFAAEPEMPAPQEAAEAAADPAMPEHTEEQEFPDSGADAEAEHEAPAGAFDKAPPKGLLIGVAAGIGALLIAGGAMVAVKKLGMHPPPPAAIETLSGAQADADKDTLASIASAEGKARDAIDLAGPKSKFPQAAAALGQIEIQWADAFNDQAALLSARNADEAKVAPLQEQAKTKLKAAFEALSAAIKADPKSQDLQLGLADYYRAQHSNSNMNKFIRNSGAKADDPRVAQIQGMAAAQEEDGAEKALPRLKLAAGASPQSARLHFRLALAYASLKDESNQRAELKETLKISPQHERAKMLIEQLGPQSAAQQK